MFSFIDSSIVGCNNSIMKTIKERLATLETKVKILMGLASAQLGLTLAPTIYPPIINLLSCF